MATSGTTVNQLSRDDIISAALRKLLVISDGQAPSATQLTQGTQALNNIVAEFRTLGMPLWARKEYLITLVTGQQDYVLGVGQVLNTPYPLHIYQAQLEQAPNFDTKIDMIIQAFQDFNNLPDLSKGTPVNICYQPQVNKGLLQVWPTPDASVLANTRVRITYQAPFEYFIAGVDTPDFPETFNNALIYQLALTLSDEYGKPLQNQAWIEKQADKHLAVALSDTVEDTSFFIQRDWQNEYY